MASNSRNLNEAQERLLRRLCHREGGEAPAEELDGRVVRALVRRNLVVQRQDRVVVTGAGRAYWEADLQNPRSASAAPPGADRSVRARCLAALDVLAEHLPGSMEVDLSHRGDGTGILVYADDLLDALRRRVARNHDWRHA